MTASLFKGRGSQCPRCGSYRVLLAPKEEHPKCCYVSVQCLRKCGECGLVFEPSTGAVLRVVVMCAGILLCGIAVLGRMLPLVARWAAGGSWAWIDVAMFVVWLVVAVGGAQITFAGIRAGRVGLQKTSVD